MEPPGGDVLDVTYKVAKSDGAYEITLVSPMGAFEFREIKVDEGSLKFAWTAGNTDLDCDLKLQDDHSYKSSCLDASGMEGILTMVPPGLRMGKKEAPRKRGHVIFFVFSETRSFLP